MFLIWNGTCYVKDLVLSSLKKKLFRLSAKFLLQIMMEKDGFLQQEDVQML